MSPKNKDIYILGAGGHGKVLLEAIKRMGFQKIFWISPELKKGEMKEGVSCRGNDEDILELNPKNILLANGIGFLPKSSLRKKTYEKFKNAGFQFLTIKDPMAYISETAHIKEGAQILMGSKVQAGVLVGENTIVNTGAQIDHDGRINAHCHIAPGAILCGDVCVEENVFIGAGSIVIQGVYLGQSSIIGAGTTITKDIKSNKLVRGEASLYEKEME